MTVKLDGDIIMGEIAATADKRYLNPAYGSLEDMGLVFICFCIYIRMFNLHLKDMGINDLHLVPDVLISTRSVCSCTCTTCHPYFFSRDAQGRWEKK